MILIISLAEVSLVRRDVLTDGGTFIAICIVRSSGKGPGPPGILPANTTAEAPDSIFILSLRQIFQPLGRLNAKLAKLKL